MDRRTRWLAVALISCAALFSGPAAAGAQDRPLPRIVGGSATTIEEWPWQVAVFDAIAGNHICGGSLIAPDLVVTAAHCVHNGFFFEPPQLYEVVTGRTALSGDGGQTLAVTAIYRYVETAEGPRLATSGTSLYRPLSRSSWDAAVLDLAGDSVQGPIALAGPAERELWSPGAPAVVTGWGATEEQGGSSDVLQEAQISILSDETCEAYRDARGRPYGYDRLTMLCAGDLTGTRDTCQGDSGGPLVVQAADSTWRLVGDTSFGDGCAREGTPAVYGRLADEPMRAPIIALLLDRGEDPSPPDPTPGNPDPTDPIDPAPAPRCLVPGLRGKTIPNARRTLRARHCRLGRITRRHSRRFRRGRIVAQRPPRGTRRAVGFRVRVVVSSGRR